MTDSDISELIASVQADLDEPVVVPWGQRPAWDYSVSGGPTPWARRGVVLGGIAERPVPASLEPVIVNSSTAILESRPKGYLALRKKLDGAGWGSVELWGLTPGLAVREIVRSEEGPGHFETTLVEVVSLSLRCYRGRERAVAIWSTRDDGETWTYELGLYRGLTGSMGIRAWTRTMLLDLDSSSVG